MDARSSEAMRHQAPVIILLAKKKKLYICTYTYILYVHIHIYYFKYPSRVFYKGIYAQELPNEEATFYPGPIKLSFATECEKGEH